MSEPVEDRVRRLITDICMTPEDVESAIRKLEAYFSSHPGEFKVLQWHADAEDSWNCCDVPCRTCGKGWHRMTDHAYTANWDAPRLQPGESQ